MLAKSQTFYYFTLYAGVMMWFSIIYTGYFNRRHRREGHLYQGLYRSILVKKESHLSGLSRYIHLNPLRPRELESEDAKVRWSYLLEVDDPTPNKRMPQAPWSPASLMRTVAKR
jgi:hypothetical protein